MQETENSRLREEADKAAFKEKDARRALEAARNAAGDVIRRWEDGTVGRRRIRGAVGACKIGETIFVYKNL